MVKKEQRNTLKDYAKKYSISVLDDKGNFKNIARLSLDIYNYEKENQKTIIGRAYYPFLKIT